MTLDYSAILEDRYFDYLVSGAITTFSLALAAWVAAIILGLLIAAVRNIDFLPTRWFCIVFVDYHRSVPLLVQLFVWYFALPELLPQAFTQSINRGNPEVFFAWVSLTLYSASYMSEDIRSGLRAIPPGQFEAARTIGMNYAKMMRWVIFPQAWRLSLPPLVNQALILFKGTSLASAIGVAELSYQARSIETQTFRAFEAFSLVTLIYMVGTIMIMFFGDRLVARYALKRG